jgi:hypothetical protein
VRDGLSRAGSARALTSFHTGNWIPLAWLSHMLDVELFGITPGGPHAVNAALHAVNAALVRRAARGDRCARAGGVRRRGVRAAPDAVESVAWMSQRKELLAYRFALCADRRVDRLGAARAARYRAPRSAPTSSRSPPSRSRSGLPFLFLLLDVWPLGRTPLARPRPLPPRAPGGTRQLFAEKLPLFALAALSCAVTFIAQSSAGAVRDLANYPLGVRIATALVAYPTYFASALWPTVSRSTTRTRTGSPRGRSPRARVPRRGERALRSPRGARPRSQSAGAGSSAGCSR